MFFSIWIYRVKSDRFIETFRWIFFWQRKSFDNGNSQRISFDSSTTNNFNTIDGRFGVINTGDNVCFDRFFWSLSIRIKSKTNHDENIRFFSFFVRIEKGMTEISVRTAEYQSLENLLLQKNPKYRLEKYREREAKEALDQQTTNPNQLTATTGTAAEKTTIVLERARIGSSVKAKGSTVFLFSTFFVFVFI